MKLAVQVWLGINLGLTSKLGVGYTRAMTRRFFAHYGYAMFMVVVLGACAPNLTTTATTSSSGSSAGGSGGSNGDGGGGSNIGGNGGSNIGGNGGSASASYTIDVNAPVSPGPETIAISTDNGDWVLSWKNDAMSHSYTGNISCAVGCILKGSLSNSFPSDVIITKADNVISFKSDPGPQMSQTIVVTLSGAAGSMTAITFDFSIDGAPALPDKVFFQSNGMTTPAETMPFTLTPAK